MNKTYLLLVFILVLAVAIGWALSGSGTSQGENRTPTDGFKEPEGGSTGDGKPIYYYFYTDTCVYCRQMEEKVLSNRTVIDAIEADFGYVKVNGGKDRKLASEYSIGAYPTNLFAYPDGSEMGRVTGAILDPDDFLDVLRQVLDFYSQNA